MSDTTQNGLARTPVLTIATLSVASIFVWFDVFLHLVLAGPIAAHFLTGSNPGAASAFALLTFAAGFVMRPLGALLFGAMGDRNGRARPVFLTLLLVGAPSLIIGLLPDSKVLGLAAPALVVVLRLVQGLALGGEAGAVSTWVAEASPDGRRGLFTSFVQAAAPLGLVLALAAALILRPTLGHAAFDDWGWRAPLVASALLVVIALLIRAKLTETAVFSVAVEEGRTSAKPLRTALSNRASLVRLSLALLGLAVGQAAVWQVSQVTSLTYMQTDLHLDAPTAQSLMAIALAISLPFYVLAGWLSDRVGRKWIIMAGCAGFAASLIPLFHVLDHAANPRMSRTAMSAPVVLVADPAQCSVMFDPAGVTRFTASCDVARTYLVNAGIPFKFEGAYSGQLAGVQVGTSDTGYIDAFKGGKLSAKDFDAATHDFANKVGAVLSREGYEATADATLVDRPMVIAVLFALALFAAMVGAPMGAMLAELFPTGVRMTSTSLVLALAQGSIGGLVPAAGLALAAATGHLDQGLWVPLFLAGLAVIVGAINLAETRKSGLAA